MDKANVKFCFVLHKIMEDYPKKKSQANRRCKFFVIAVVLLFVSAVISLGVMIDARIAEAAESPSIITYQGKVLVNESAATTTLSMYFVLYDALTAGNVLYTAGGTIASTSSVSVTPTNGLFTVNLGDTGTNALNPNIFRDNGSVYLEVRIGNEILTPRKRITASPYAYNSAFLNGVGTNTVSSSTYIPVSDADGNFNFRHITSTELYVNGPATFTQYMGFTSASGTAVTSTDLYAVNGSITNLRSGNAILTGGSINGVTIGDTTSSTAKFSAATSTDFFATNGSFTSLTVTNPVSFAELTWTNATGTAYTNLNFLTVTATSTLATTTISGRLEFYTTSTNAAIYTSLASSTSPVLNIAAPDARTVTQIVKMSNSNYDYFLGNANYFVTTSAYLYLRSPQQVRNSYLEMIVDDDGGGTRDIYYNGASGDFTDTNGVTTNTTNRGFSLYFYGGAGGTSGNGGSAGGVNIYGGTATGTAYAGDINLGAGATYGTRTGGGVNIYAGANANNGAYNGGALQMYTGQSYGTGNGGAVNIYTGQAASSGSGGAISIYTGKSAGTGNGGALSLYTGNSEAGGSAGKLTLYTGDVYVSSTSAVIRGGDMLFYTGNAVSSTVTGGGDIIFYTGRDSNGNTPGQIKFFDPITSNAPSVTSVGSVASTTLLTGASRFTVSGTYAYVPAYSVNTRGQSSWNANIGNSLAIVDISSPSAPTITGSISNSSTLSNAIDVKVYNQTAYILTYTGLDGATYSGNLTSVDVSNPASPSVLSSYNNASYINNPKEMVLEYPYAYISNTSLHSILILDISNPSSMTRVGSLVDATNLSYVGGITKSGNYIYAAAFGGSQKGLTLIDVTDPANPVYKSSVTGTAYFPDPVEVAVSGNYAYVTNYDGKLFVVVDVSNPNSPTVVGSVKSDLLNGAFSIAISGNFAYVSGKDNGNKIAIIDITTPTKPVVVGTYKTTSGATSRVGNYLQVSGTSLYYSDGPTGVFRVLSIGDNASKFYSGYFNNKVGIGTSTTNLLDVWGASAFGSATSSAVTFRGQVQSDILPYTNLTYNLGSSGYRWNNLWAGTVNVGTSTWSLGAQSNGSLGIWDSASQGGNLRLTIATSTGNIGIGTTSPSDKLTVIGNMTAGNGTSTSTLNSTSLIISKSASDNVGKFYVDSSGVVSASSSLQTYGSLGVGYLEAAATKFPFYVNSSGEVSSSNTIQTYAGLIAGKTDVDGVGKFYADSNGNTSASGTLNVFGTATTTNLYPATNLTYDLGNHNYRWNNLWVGTVNIGTSTWSLGPQSNGSLGIWDGTSLGGNLRLSIATTTGNVGIGVATSNEKLTVVGNIAASDGSSYVSILGSNFLRVASTTGYSGGKFYVDSSGNVSTSGTLSFAGDLLPVTSPTSGTTVIQTSESLNGTENDIYPAATVGKDGYAIIAYYASTTADLKVRHCTNYACSASDVTTIDGTVGGTETGSHPSIAIGVDGNPVITYFDLTNDKIRFVHCTNYACTAFDNPIDLASATHTGVGSVNGMYSSVAIGYDGFPMVVFSSSVAASNDATVYSVHCTSIDCATKDVQETVATNFGAAMTYPGLVGEGMKILIPSDRRPIVAYYANGSGAFVAKFRYATSTAEIQTYSLGAESTTSGRYPSMMLGSDGMPFLVSNYWNIGGGGQILYANHCNASPCDGSGDWSQIALVTTNIYSNYNHHPSTALAIASDGKPVIYVNRVVDGAPPGDDTVYNDPFLIHCSDMSCAGDGSAPVYSFEGSFLEADSNVHANGASMVRLGDGSLGISNFEVGDGMKYWRTCAANSCALGGALAGANLGNVKNYFYRMYTREMYAQQAYLSGFDLAESYLTKDLMLEAGDLVSIDEANPLSVTRANLISSNKVMGIVSTKPGLLLSEWAGTTTSTEQNVAVALAGRVPVKVNMENGPIAIGDSLTLSNEAGIARRANPGESTIGRALESIVVPGKITAFVKLQWADEGGSALTFDDTGHLVTFGTTSTPYNILVNGSVTSTGNLYVLGDAYLGEVASGTWNGAPINSNYGGVGADSSGWSGVAKLKNGIWSADKVFLTEDVNGILPVTFGGTGISTFSKGAILFGGENTLAQDATNLYWDAENKFLGIGTTSTTARLTVGGDVALSGNISFTGDAAAKLNFTNTATFESGVTGVKDARAFILNASSFDSNSKDSYLLSLRSGGKSVLSVAANGDFNTLGTITAASLVLGTSTNPGDLAERVDVAVGENVEAGDVLIVDEDNPDTYRRSRGAYEQAVAGVVSTNPTIIVGNGKTDFTVSMAMVGRVPVKVSAENGEIKKGDLLVSATDPGVAMKYDPGKDDGPKMVGVIGVALENLATSSTGKIMALIRTGWARNQTETILGLKKSVQDLTSAKATGDLSVGNKNGKLEYDGGDLNLTGSLLGVASIVSRDNRWRIDADGRFVTRLTTVSGGDKDMFAMQSPTTEFVFSSSSQLMAGEVKVEFDEATREIIDFTQPLKITVTLTSGEAKGIYVSEKTNIGFTVKELQAGTSNATFDWMVVAKRRDESSPITQNPEVLVEDPIIPPTNPPTDTDASSTPPSGGGSSGTPVVVNPPTEPPATETPAPPVTEPTPTPPPAEPIPAPAPEPAPAPVVTEAPPAAPPAETASQ